MTLSIEEVRGRDCLAYFRCGVDEIETFSKKAYKRHVKTMPDYRVRVLYNDAVALGFHTLSLKAPDKSGNLIDKNIVYYGTEAFLYLDHLAVKTEEQGKDYSTALMVDVLEICAQTMEQFGRVHALALNAANPVAKQFFEKWGFVQVTDSTTPFMVMYRDAVIATYNGIARLADAG